MDRTSCLTAEGLPKVRYGTRAEAKRALRWMERKMGDDFDPANAPYRCAECGYFHVGRYPTNPNTRRRLRAAHR
jgi:hypothetical protein